MEEYYSYPTLLTFSKIIVFVFVIVVIVIVIVVIIFAFVFFFLFIPEEAIKIKYYLSLRKLYAN